jgi:hypothetical protein
MVILFDHAEIRSHLVDAVRTVKAGLVVIPAGPCP